jgi:Wiskott-Aldrich syndrome protein
MNIFNLNKAPRKAEVSAPTDFLHISHIGWDPEKGFDIHNIPPEWQKLFKAAGVRKADIQDADVAKMLVNIVADALTAPGGGSAPPPPPPPPPSSSAPPPPPPPPGSGIHKASPHSQPLQQKQGSSLQDQLKNAQLKKAPSTLPSIQNLDDSTNNNLINVLSNAMKQRRVNLEEDPPDSDEEEDWN